jgi:hypothetical protein
MPELALDYTQIAPITESGSARLRDRLTERGFVLEDSPEPMEVEGGPAAMVTHTKVVVQNDLSLPWDGYNNHLLNCGPSCVSMVLMHATGEVRSPDSLIDEMKGDNYKGYTNISDLTGSLSRHGVPADARQASSLQEFQSILRGQVAQGRLSIILIYWDWNANTGGHYVVNYLVDEPGADVGYMNPWRGTRDKYAWERLWPHVIHGWVITPKYSPKGKFVELAENWYATTKTDVNVRSGPSTRYSVVRVIPANTRLYFSKYTDQGQAVKGSEPERRWHYAERAGGWLYDGGLERWERP